jgi:hypothetical protein
MVGMGWGEEVCRVMGERNGELGLRRAKKKLLSIS